MTMILIEITLARGVIAQEELKDLLQALPVPAGGTEGVVISGRLPVWAYSALVHHFHPRPWVATFDPRLGGGVVVATHDPKMKVGTVVATDNATVVPVVFEGGAQ